MTSMFQPKTGGGTLWTAPSSGHMEKKAWRSSGASGFTGGAFGAGGGSAFAAAPAAGSTVTEYLPQTLKLLRSSQPKHWVKRRIKVLN